MLALLVNLHQYTNSRHRQPRAPRMFYFELLGKVYGEWELEYVQTFGDGCRQYRTPDGYFVYDDSPCSEIAA